VYEACRIMNMIKGPSGITPMPSQVCEISIHERGITTATKARISVTPTSRKSQASRRREFMWAFFQEKVP
jgi:hypothetical protein